MITANDSELENPDADSMWLQLSFEGQAYPFELPSDETRAIAVGSLLRADLRIDRPGVAPVQFHIEREADRLWIVPAYGSEGLRVDTARVSGPRRIDARAVIDFCGVRVEATVLEIPPTPRRTSSARLRQSAFAERAPLGPSKVFEEHEPPTTNGGALPTVAIERFVSPTLPLPEQPTTRFAPLANSTVIPVQRTVVIEPFRVTPLEPVMEKTPITLKTGTLPPVAAKASEASVAASLMTADTIETQPFWLDEPGPEPAIDGDESVSGQPIAQVAEELPDFAVTPNQVTVAIAPVRIRAVGDPSDKGRASLPAAQHESLKTSNDAVLSAEERQQSQAAPTEVLSSGPETPPQETSYFEPMRISRAPFGPEESSSQDTIPFDVPSPPSRNPIAFNWMAQLGLLSKRRPLLVWLGATATAFLLAATVTRLSRHEKHSPPPNPSQVQLMARTAPSAIATVTPSSAIQHRAPVSLVVIPATPMPASATRPKKGQPQNPELVAAVDSLISGHQSDAQVAYSKLATATPNDQALLTVSRLLAKKLSSQCSSSAPHLNVSCPEVKP